MYSDARFGIWSARKTRCSFLDVQGLLAELPAQLDCGFSRPLLISVEHARSLNARFGPLDYELVAKDIERYLLQFLAKKFFTTEAICCTICLDERSQH